VVRLTRWLRHFDKLSVRKLSVRKLSHRALSLSKRGLPDFIGLTEHRGGLPESERATDCQKRVIFGGKDTGTMRISETRKGNVLVVSVSERVDSVTSPELERHLSGLVQAGERRVLVNCTSLNYISSAGLRVFLSTAKKLGSAGGKFMLCSLGGMVKEVFQMSGFYDILTIFDSEDKALADG
jgi:anti-anti-sigma factor